GSRGWTSRPTRMSLAGDYDLQVGAGVPELEKGERLVVRVDEHSGEIQRGACRWMPQIERANPHDMGAGWLPQRDHAVPHVRLAYVEGDVQIGQGSLRVGRRFENPIRLAADELEQDVGPLQRELAHLETAAQQSRQGQLRLDAFRPGEVGA